MKMIFNLAVAACFVSASSAAATPSSRTQTKSCDAGIYGSNGTQTCAETSADDGATWSEPACGPCVGPVTVHPTMIIEPGGSGVITIESANGGKATFRPGETVPPLAPGGKVTVESGETVFEVDTVRVAAGAGASFLLKAAGGALEITSLGAVAVTTTDKNGTLTLKRGLAYDIGNDATVGLAVATAQTGDQWFEAAARKALQELAEAYSSKRRVAFMRLVSDDFKGNLGVLEEALNKDFDSYRAISLDLVMDNIVSHDLLASVGFHYNVSVVSDLGVTSKFQGNSNYVFQREGDKVKLYQMNMPILFGNSMPPQENPIAGGQNLPSAISSKAPGKQAAISDSATITTAVPSFSPGSRPIPGSGFVFDTQRNVPDSSADIILVASGAGPMTINANSGRGIVFIESCNIASVSAAPATITGTSGSPLHVGSCFAVKTATTKYAVLRITSIGVGSPGSPPSIDFDYKYQPSGSNKF